MKIEVHSFKDKIPKRGMVACFSEDNSDADIYFIDGTGDVWSKSYIDSEAEYACEAEELQEYGMYSHWMRTNKFLNIKMDIPE